MNILILSFFYQQALLISWSLQLLRILKKQQQGKAIRKKEKRPYLDENDSLMHGRTVTAPQQIASGVIKQARSVENLQGLSRDRLSFFRSTTRCTLQTRSL